MYEDIYRVSEKARLASHEEVDALEATLGCAMPKGYREFVTSFGEGDITTLVRVHCPWTIAASYRQFQEGISEYFFWEAGHAVLSKQQVVQSIRVADTMVGSQLIFHPAQSDRLLVLPREDEQIFVAGADLETAFTWLFNFHEQMNKLKAFNPWADRERTHFAWAPNGARPPRVIQKLLELGLHDKYILEKSDKNDPFLELFVREFGGSVIVISELDYDPPGEFSVSWVEPDTRRSFVDGIPTEQIPRRPDIWIDHEEGVRGVKFTAIVRCLEEQGLHQRKGLSG